MDRLNTSALQSMKSERTHDFVSREIYSSVGGNINSIAFHPSKRHIAFSGNVSQLLSALAFVTKAIVDDDRRVTIIDYEQIKTEQIIYVIKHGQVTRVCWMRVHQTILLCFGCADGTVHLYKWDPIKKSYQHQTEHRVGFEAIHCITAHRSFLATTGGRILELLQLNQSGEIFCCF
jgi:WD40 repeat protein